MKSRIVGLITADLNAAANLIRLRMRFNNGKEFLVWVQGDKIMLAPTATNEAMATLKNWPEQVVNTYVLAMQDPKFGEKTFLDVKWIREDLEQYLADHPVGEPA